MNLKLPPQDIEAERSVLGALMLDRNAVIQVADLIKPEDFYLPNHSKIFEVILELFEKGEPIDILTVTQKLKDKNLLNEIGGSTYLTDLINSVPTTAHVSYYAKVVRERKVLRDLIEASAEINEKIFDTSEDTENLLDEIEQKIFSISQKSRPKKFTHIKDELKAAYERIEKLHQGERSLRGVPTGFDELDNYLSGLQRSDLIILGARPSLGKTSFCLDVARNAGVKHKIPVGIFSLEMSKDQIIDRLIAAQAQVTLWKLRTGRLSEEIEFEMIQEALDRLSQAPIFIDDTPSANIIQIRSMARRLQAEYGLGLLVVDYLQLIQPRTNTDSMVQAMTEVSRGLKALARELEVPVLAAAQLSRAVEQRDVKIPRLADLRESGCLSGDTLIMNAETGELLKIKDLAERQTQEPIPVYSLNENWQIVIKPIIKVFSSGYKKLYELKTRSGRIIKASANHPFRKLDNWYRLDELKPGDRIAITRKLNPINPQNPLTDEELILLAHLLGDGCTVPKQAIHYTSADLENIEFVRKAAHQLFGIKSKLIKQKNWYHLYLTTPYRLTKGKHHPITNWLNKLGIGLKHSYEKKIPETVFQCDQDKIRLFLHHLWSTDGNISWKILTGRQPSATIYYSTTSFELVQQVQHLLLRLGVQSTIRSVQKKNYRLNHQIHVQGNENQLRFLTLIGCAGQKGKIIPSLIKALQKITPNPNTDIIPKEAWHIVIEPAKAVAGISWREFSNGIKTAYCGSTLFKAGLSRQRLNRIATFLQNKTLENLASSDIYWDEIVSITPLAVEEVYDATVVDTHNFVANDIIVHNSIEQEADVVLFIYRKDRDKLKVSPEEENLAEIIIAKHRNGPLGTVQLKFDADKASFRSIEKFHTENEQNENDY